ncbi:MAG: nucleotidyl transferase AbiEii/AbiGii toxin family protein [Rhodobacteraceae bacterium]|nr:nucleotidyl transferase AbiEii/AbiGii toxin family protein [Paracoccaceae bacterium]
MVREIMDTGASVRTRLLKISRENGQNYELILIRYANERFLYRLSQSEHAHRFVLKGAMLLMSWLGVLFRGSRDVDMLGYGDTDPKTVLAVFQDIFAQEVDDGVCFDANGAQVSRIREDGVHGGLRIKTTADIDGARIQVRIDIGFGDITEPKPKMLDLPGLLDMPTAPLRGYARETVIAEKFEAMVSLGLSNSRTKDYYDIWLLSQSFDFDQTQLGRSIAATFENRGTVIPA